MFVLTKFKKKTGVQFLGGVRELMEITPRDVLADSLLDVQVPEVTSRAGVEAALRHGKRTLSAARAWLQQRRAPRAVPSTDKVTSLQAPPIAYTRHLKRRDTQRRTRADSREENVRMVSRERLPRRSSKRTERQSQVICEIPKERVNTFSVTSSQSSVSEIYAPNFQREAYLSPHVHRAASVTSHKSVASHVSASSHVDAEVQTASDTASNLCRQTLQPLTIRNALVCQPGPNVRISPAPLQLRDRNMCVSEIRAAGTDEQTSQPHKTVVTQSADPPVEKPQVLSSVVGTQTSPEIFQINEMRRTSYAELNKDTSPRTDHEVRSQLNPTNLLSEKLSRDIATQTSLLFSLLGINQQERADSDVTPINPVTNLLSNTDNQQARSESDITPIPPNVLSNVDSTVTATETLVAEITPVANITPHTTHKEDHLMPHIKPTEKPAQSKEPARKKPLSIVTAAVVSVVPETSIAVQTELRGQDVATATSPIDLLEVDQNLEIGPHGDCGVPLSLICKNSLTSTQTVQEKLRMLSPIPEQPSTSENSTCNASPLAVPAASLSIPSADVPASLSIPRSDVPASLSLPSANIPASLSIPSANVPTSLSIPSAPEQHAVLQTNIEQTALLQPSIEQSAASADVQAMRSPEQSAVLQASIEQSASTMFIPIEAEVEDASASQDLTYSIPAKKGERVLPLLSLTHRMMRALETHDILSEHDASSTLSSLADSELSSLDTTASSSLTMVENTLLRSEGEVVPPVNFGNDEDTTASDDSSSLPKEDWSRGSGCSSGMLERSVGETRGVIPAAQRRRVLYLASRVAPSLLTSSEGELSEGQVLPRSKVTSHAR